MIRPGRRKGQIALLAAILLIPASALLLSAMNSGQMIEDRRRTQDAADALARMHGVWGARSLNAMAGNNVAIAQSLVVAIGSEALSGTLDELDRAAIGVMLYIAWHARRECPKFKRIPKVGAALYIICLAQHWGQAGPARRARSEVRRIDRRYTPDRGTETARRALRALDGMNAAIVARFSRAMGEIAVDYARDLDIEASHFIDPCDGDGAGLCAKTDSSDGMALPVVRDTQARLETCAAMQFGTLGGRTSYARRGFRAGRGPLTGGGSAARPHVRDHINDDTRIGRELERFHRFYRRARLMRLGPSRRIPQYLNLSPPQRAAGSNSFTRRFDAKHASLCLLGGAGGGIPLLDYGLDTPAPDFWRAVDVMPMIPGPVTTAGMSERYRIAAVVSRRQNRRIGGALLRAPTQGPFAYAQTTLYNPEGADLHSQSWRARLTPASRLNDPARVAGQLSGQAPNAFAPLVEVLRASASQGGWERLNVH